MDVLGPDANGQQPAGDAAQQRDPVEQFEHERRLRPLRRREGAADDLVLHDELEPLREAHGECSARLDRAEVVVAHGTGLERRDQAVGGGDCVLDGEVDADAADRRHRVRGIADADAAPAATTAATGRR